MLATPGLPHRVPQRSGLLLLVLGLKHQQQQTGATRLRELSPRGPQMALQTHQMLHNLPQVRGIPTNEELVDHSDQDRASLPEAERFLRRSRETSRKDQASREGQTSGYFHARLGLSRSAQDP